MGDKFRFSTFALMVHQAFPRQEKIIDVAGGKGYLQYSLRQLGYNVVTYDPKGKPFKRNLSFVKKLFTTTTKVEADLLVGMHPDGATDCIVVQAIKRNVPFAIVPCCIIPVATSFKGSFNGWLNHLTQLARPYKVERHYLNIKGKNTVLVGFPR